MPFHRKHILLKDATSALFIICLNLYYLLGISQFSEKITIVETALLSVGIVSLVFHYIAVINRQTNLNLLIMLIFLVAIGGIAFYLSGGPTLLKLILFALAIVEVDKYKILRYQYYSLVLGILIILGSSIFGIIPMEYARLEGVYTFGFVNPNNLLMVYIAAIMTYNLLHEGQVKMRTLFVEFALAAVIFRFTNSRTGMLVTSIYLMNLIIGKVDSSKKISRKFMAVGNYLFIILSAISMFLALGYQKGDLMWEKIDVALSWRPFLWGRYFDDYSITLLGTRLDMDRFGSLDNAYLTLLLKYGVLVFGVYLILFVSMSRRAVQQNKWDFVACIIAYEIYFVSEFGPVLVNVNIALLIEIHYLMNRRKIEQGILV